MKKIMVVILMCIFTLPVFAKNTILIMGDSLSAGYGIDPNQGWVALLRNRLQEKNFNYEVVNSSISGDTTSQGLARMSNVLKHAKPKVIIIELGANDGLRGLAIATIQANLQKMIDLAKKEGSQVLLLGIRLPPNYGPAYTDEFHKMYIYLKQINQIQLVPLFLNQIDEDPDLLQSDKLHPQAKAQEMMLDNVWPTLEAMLKK